MLVSVAFAHELRHIAQISFEDILDDHSYGWTNILKMTPSQGIQNADSHAYLDVMATLQNKRILLAFGVNPAFGELELE